MSFHALGSAWFLLCFFHSQVLHVFFSKCLRHVGHPSTGQACSFSRINFTVPEPEACARHRASPQAWWRAQTRAWTRGKHMALQGRRSQGCAVHSRSPRERRGVFITEPHAASHSSFEGSVKDFPKEAAFGVSLIHESKLTTHVQAKSTGCMQVLWREARGLWSVRLQKGAGGEGRERTRLAPRAGVRSCGLRNFSEATRVRTWWRRL